MDDNIIRIMVSTDNHLGFMEKDPVRCNDSFAAFEEVFLNAKAAKADLILFAGDMFHENKPSRRTMYGATQIFKKYCLGDNPIFIEIANEQSECFKRNGGLVNFQDAHLSIDLPVFAIHGNHDDPSRDGGSGDSLSALDIISATNFVNYIGKNDEVDKIEIYPVIVEKNNATIAIYSLGAVRDERLNRMWNQKKLNFVRSTRKDGKSDKVVNIFIIHQNRDYGRGKKNCIHESMIPEWMDIVIWGNEHECMPVLHDSLIGNFHIYQPGSSVATSLVEGESAAYPKSMGLLSVNESKQFKLKAIPYTQIRPFVYDEVNLQAKELGLDTKRPDIEEKIKEVLSEKAREMIAEARKLSKKVSEAQPGLTYRVKDPKQVLIRMRVDHAGFPVINQQRFGAQFVGDVANPPDILLFSKRKKEVQSVPNTASSTAAGTSRSSQKASEESDVSKISIEDMVQEMISGSKKKMIILNDEAFSSALVDFVVKRNPAAINDTVEDMLKHAQKLMINCEVGVGDPAAFAESAALAQRKVAETYMADGASVARGRMADFVASPVRSDNEKDDDHDDDFGEVKKKTPAKKAPAKRAPAKKAPAKKAAKKAASDDEDEIDDDGFAQPRKKSSRAAASKKTYADLDDDDDDVVLMAASDDDVAEREYGDDDEEEEEYKESPPAKKAKAAARKPAAPRAKAAAKPVAPRGAAKGAAVALSEDIDDFDEDMNMTSTGKSIRSTFQRDDGLDLTGRTGHTHPAGGGTQASLFPASASQASKRALPGTVQSPSAVKRKIAKASSDWD